MKQKITIGLWMIAGTLCFTSCSRNTQNNAAMKMPLQSTEDPGKKSATVPADTTGMIVTKKKSTFISP